RSPDLDTADGSDQDLYAEGKVLEGCLNLRRVRRDAQHASRNVQEERSSACPLDRPGHHPGTRTKVENNLLLPDSEVYCPDSHLSVGEEGYPVGPELVRRDDPLEGVDDVLPLLLKSGATELPFHSTLSNLFITLAILFATSAAVVCRHSSLLTSTPAAPVMYAAEQPASKGVSPFAIIAVV